MEILAAGLQALLLLGVGVYVFVESIWRLIEPPEIAAVTPLPSRRCANLNLRAAFLEVINDGLGSVAVIVGRHRYRHERLDPRRRGRLATDLHPDPAPHHGLLRDTARILLETHRPGWTSRNPPPRP